MPEAAGRVFPASCSCGAARLTLTALPRHRFFCHCTVCQTVYRAPFADVTVIRADRVAIETPEAIAFARYKSPPAIERGICTNCGKPVVALADMPLSPRLAFIAAKNFDDAAALPPSSMHIHYGTRSADIDDTLPKRSGPLVSQLAAMRPILGAIFS
ncbi:hypothetical protein HFP57_03690 [Parasphingopyxis algicola]|uniref:GFA family protein n=1 Tax=Parasphingopyxis algicola TaxID=2026624 RepID=UPI0015A01B5E|nr:GFA family protein [Parasphingopyxis algicola]QLC24218.1 hypothetical protein HFP57_03690 [Parasphingopyxis algicola]